MGKKVPEGRDAEENKCWKAGMSMRIMLLSFDGRTQEKRMEINSIGFLLSTKMAETVSE